MRHISILFAVVGLVAVTHLAFIQHRPAVDETIWLEHSETFARAVTERNWERTRTTTRPGVTVQWIIAGVTAAGGSPTAVRIVFAGLTTITAIALFLLLIRFVSRRVALAAAILTPLQPLIVTGAVAWTDLLLGWFIALTIVLFAASHTFGNHQREYVIITTGVLFGLAILTKIVSWLLPVMLLSMLMAKRNWLTELPRHLLPLASISLIGILTAFLLYPAAWANPLLLIDRTSEVSISPTPGTSVATGLTAYVARFFSYDPVLLILSFISLGIIIKLSLQSNSAATSLSRFFIPAAVYAAALLLITTLSDSQVEQIVSARYLVPITPLLIIGSVQCIDWLDQRVRLPVFTIAVSLLLASYALLSAVSFGVLGS